MHGARTTTGTMLQYELPVWEPLLAVVGGYQAAWFMWMHEIELEDGTRVHAYKHVSTRCYMHLAGDGRAFAYLGERRYREIDPDMAADLALAGWQPEDDA
jgi:hypothetical protein